MSFFRISACCLLLYYDVKICNKRIKITNYVNQAPTQNKIKCIKNIFMEKAREKHFFVQKFNSTEN